MRKMLSNRFQRFFANRAPQADTATLTLRNVYIFFSRGGLLYGLLLVITFITGVNYGNNLVLGLCFYLASIWVISLHLTFAHVAGLRLKLQHTQLVQAGNISWIDFEIVNHKSKPSRQLLLTFAPNRQKILSSYELDYDSQTSTQNLNHKSAHPKDKDADTEDSLDIWQQLGVNPSQTLASLQGVYPMQLPVMTYKRGQLIPPRLLISTVYPLGIMRAWSYVYFASPIWVYPLPKAFDLEATRAVDSHDEQDLSAHTTIGQNDFESLDEFQQGESLGRVSWAHVARGQGMLTKHFADSIGQEQQLNYSDMPAAHHEEKLSQLTYAVLKLSAAGSAFQLNLPNDKGGIGQGDAFAQSCLMRLAQCP